MCADKHTYLSRIKYVELTNISCSQLGNIVEAAREPLLVLATDVPDLLHPINEVGLIGVRAFLLVERKGDHNIVLNTHWLPPTRLRFVAPLAHCVHDRVVQLWRDMLDYREM